MTACAKLIEEAALYANDDGIMGMPGSQNYVFCDLICRLAAALRELAPPEGWTPVVFANKDGHRIEWSETAAFATALAWQQGTRYVGEFPTIADAMAALDAEKAPPVS